MTAPPPETTPRPAMHDAERSIVLALRLAHAENALHALSSGQVDAIIDSDGRPYLLRPAQEHLRQNERRLQAILESAADMITLVDRGGRIVFQNRAVTPLLGYDAASRVREHLFDFIHIEDLPQLYSAFFNVIEEFQPDAIVQFRHLHRDGTYRPLEATMSRLRDATVTQVVMVSRNVARRRSDWEDELSTSLHPSID